MPQKDDILKRIYLYLNEMVFYYNFWKLNEYS